MLTLYRTLWDKHGCVKLSRELSTEGNISYNFPSVVTLATTSHQPKLVAACLKQHWCIVPVKYKRIAVVHSRGKVVILPPFVGQRVVDMDRGYSCHGGVVPPSCQHNFAFLVQENTAMIHFGFGHRANGSPVIVRQVKDVGIRESIAVETA